MNWFRFKVELTAWAVKTFLCTLTGVMFTVMTTQLSDTTPDMLYLTPGEQLVDQSPGVVPAVLLPLTVFLWWMALWALRNARRDSRYGEV